MSSEYTYLIGRVGTDPEKKVVSGGKELVEFRLAVDGAYDPGTKDRPTEWYSVTVWEPLSDVIAFGKGARVWVAGTISVWHGDTGDRKKITAREIGTYDRLFSSEIKEDDKPKAKAPEMPAPEGIVFDDGEW